ncbi:unnamed protein product [Polarella glacialis]|uniref:Uncharacterized protein n=1 Tax=Polarella glacialis TaxID=89957 RepID=A0A813E7M4_POLGL|nr:unnamed protein product [Polarella glacialis]
MPLAPATGEPHSRRGKHGVRATGSSQAGHAPDYPADHQTSNERSSGSNWKNEGEESVKEKGAYSSRHLDYDTFPPLQQKPVNSGYKETSEWVDWQHAAGGSSTEDYSWDSSWTSGRWSNRRSAEQDTQKYKEEEQVEAEPAYEPLPSRENDNKEYFPRRWSPSVPAAAAVAELPLAEISWKPALQATQSSLTVVRRLQF